MSDKESKKRPFNEQCYLMENIRALAGARESAGGYSRLNLLDGSPGHVISQINHGGQTRHRRALLDLCPDVYALLTPYVKIYRVLYTKSNPKKIKKVADPESELIPFKNFTSRDDIQRITDQKHGRIAGGGIKEFTWSLDGVQPAEVTNNITATLTCHFQSLFDLFSENINSSGRYQAGIPGQPGFLDLIIGPGTSIGSQSETRNNSSSTLSGFGACGIEHAIYEGENFRLKAVVGWSTPPGFHNMTIPGYTSQQLKDLAAAIKNTRTVLFLQITSHDIKFEQDGSLTLTCNYQAGLEGIMTSPNADILSKPLGGARQADTEEEMQAREERFEERNPEGNNEDVREERREYLEDQSTKQRADRLLRYENFLNGLFGDNSAGKARIYTLELSSEELLKAPYSDLSPEERAERARSRTSESPTQSSTTGGNDLVDDVARAREEGEDVEAGSSIKYKTFKELDKAGYFDDDKYNDKYILSFFYLGDLIDSILENLYDADAQDFKLLISKMTMIDPLQFYQNKYVTLQCAGGTKKITALDYARKNTDLFKHNSGGMTFKMYISSFPISLIEFNKWFMTNVIKEEKDSMFLLQFVQSMLSDMVTGTFSKNCFGESLYYRIQTNTIPFLLDKSAVSRRMSTNGVATAKRLVDSANAGAGADMSAVWPTQILYSVEHPPRSANFVTDLNDGIYHYYLGANCGLLKNITFSRLDNPGYREARTQKQAVLGAEQLRELYQVNLGMVGNTLHMNGAHIYLNPVTIGSGLSNGSVVTNIAKMMGLAGYFMILKVQYTVSDQGFDSSMSAFQQAIADDTRYEGSAQYEDADPGDTAAPNEAS